MKGYINYNQNRIESNSAVGVFSYEHFTKPHALTNIELFDSNTISLDSSVLTYTLFNKVKTIEEGEMTGDLLRLADPAPASSLNSWDFVDAILKRM